MRKRLVRGKVTGRLSRLPVLRAFITCLHPTPPGFTSCNRYGYATCLTCKTKLPC